MSLTFDFTGVMSPGDQISGITFYISNSTMALVSNSNTDTTATIVLSNTLQDGFGCNVSCSIVTSQSYQDGRAIRLVCYDSGTNGASPISPITPSMPLTRVYELIVNGNLAVATDIAAHLYIAGAGSASGVNATLKTAPSGGSVTLSIYQSSNLSTPWATLTIPSGTTSVALSAGAVAALAPVASGGYWRLDVTGVPSTPGADLVVTILV